MLEWRVERLREAKELGDEKDEMGRAGGWSRGGEERGGEKQKFLPLTHWSIARRRLLSRRGAC